MAKYVFIVQYYSKASDRHELETNEIFAAKKLASLIKKARRANSGAFCVIMNSTVKWQRHKDK